MEFSVFEAGQTGRGYAWAETVVHHRVDIEEIEQPATGVEVEGGQCNFHELCKAELGQ